MLNSSGNFSSCQPQSFNTVVAIFLSIIVFVGFVLNCISLWIFWFKVKQWNSMVVLQFSLAISDALLTPVVPLLIIYYLTDHWIFGLFFCQLTVFLLSTHMYGSIYFLTLISIHRYFTIAHSVKRKALTTKPFIKKLCFTVWGCLLCQGLPFFLALKNSKVHGVTKCLNFHQGDQGVLYFVWNWVIFFSGFLIPFSITLVCYSLLIRYILKANPMNSFSKVMLSRSVLTVFVSLIIFIVCYVPSHVFRTMAVTALLLSPNKCSVLESAEVGYNFSRLLVGINCCLDPILYCFASERFQRSFTSCCTLWGQRGNRAEAPLNIHYSGPLPATSTTGTGPSGQAS